MLHAFGANEPVCHLLNNAGLPPHYEHFKAVMAVEVDVHRAYHHVVVLVLDVRECVG